MGWNNAGAVVRTDGVRSGSDVHEQQRLAGVKVRSDLTDTELEDLATAIENCVARDGQNAASANLPMGSYKHTGVATGSGAASRSEYVSGATLQDGAVWDAGSTGGTSTAFTATLSPAIAAYADKQLFRVKFNATFGSTPTINFNTVGAKKMYYMLGSTVTQLTTGNVPSGYHALLRYDSALDSSAGAFMLLNPPAELAASTLTSQIGALTAETTIATDDLIVITDTSESDAANKMTVANFLKAINALTEDTNPDESADFLLSWDNSASAVKKVAFVNYALAASQKPAGSVIQRVNTQTGSVSTGTTQMPLDDTIPQNTEGDEYMTLAITPTNASNILYIDVLLNAATTVGASSQFSVALFQDSTAGALAAVAQGAIDSGQMMSVRLTHKMTAGTTSATTFKVRAGGNGAGTTTFNGRSSGRIFGGVMASSITITEIKA